jgi:hypothetical protein
MAFGVSERDEMVRLLRNTLDFVNGRGLAEVVRKVFVL